jgi:hypothetical protein
MFGKHPSAVGRVALAIIALALPCGAAHAATVTYNVSPVLGLTQISGTITTNGTLGYLTGSDIVAWSMTVNGISFSSTNPGAVTEVSGSLQATNTGLALTGTSGGLNLGNRPAGFNDPLISFGHFVLGPDDGYAVPFTIQLVRFLGLNVAPNQGFYTESINNESFLVIATAPTPSAAIPLPSAAVAGLCLLAATGLRRR